ncbi:hypothetical protein [Candidatus Villigracilis affinis]|uniref:hypothetical protein n=1 Tax=Candidatus Villigracilis affinis TaxID=3140682 RepID=UPI002A1EF9D1|nr:hypothetical protein [Anaerolineales bacterium]
MHNHHPTSSIPISNAEASFRPWLMLISRSVLFILFQSLDRADSLRNGHRSPGMNLPVGGHSRHSSPTSYPFICSCILPTRKEKAISDVIHFSRETWKKDLAWFFGTSLIRLPIGPYHLTVLAAALLVTP